MLRLNTSLPEVEEKSVNSNPDVHIYFSVFPTSNTSACPEAHMVTNISFPLEIHPKPNFLLQEINPQEFNQKPKQRTSCLQRSLYKYLLKETLITDNPAVPNKTA